MSEETIKIGKWDVPKNLYDEYVKFRTFADAYTDGTEPTPCDGTPAAKYERAARWQLCVQRIMQIHREICAVLGIAYSEDTDDEFYGAFFKKTHEDAKLKGG